MKNAAASGTVPTFMPSGSDTPTGIGHNATDQLSIIARSFEMLRATGHVTATSRQVTIGPGATLIGSAAIPSLAFGDGDTGFRESADDTLEIDTLGLPRFNFSANVFGANQGAGPGMLNEDASATNPTFVPNQADPDTGLGRGGVDRLNLIAGGITCMSVEETGGSTPQIGFYATAPISLQTGVAVTAAGVHAALVNLGLITA